MTATYSLVQTPRLVADTDATPDYLKYSHAHQVLNAATKTESFTVNGADLAVALGASIATTDIFQIFSVPAGALILSLTHVVSTAEGGTCTYNIGDGGSATRFVSGGNGNTTTNANYATPYYYAAADTIDFALASGTLATAVINISVTYALTAPSAT